MEELLRDKLNKRMDIVTKMAFQTETKLKGYPEGRIKISKRGKNTYYYQISNRTNLKLLKNTDRKIIDKLIQKRYLEKVLDAFKTELDALNKMQKLYPETIAEEIYDGLSDERKAHIKPIIPTDEQFVSRWLSEPYTKKPISDDVPVYVTKKGERVRSKSEMIIANMLYDCGIPYKYECPVLVGGEIFHPDFTILRLSDRKIIYYEHCGRMGDPGYVEDMIERSRKYALEGIFQGEKLFYTFESAKQPLDVRVVTAMIENNFR